MNGKPAIWSKCLLIGRVLFQGLTTDKTNRTWGLQRGIPGISTSDKRLTKSIFKTYSYNARNL